MRARTMWTLAAVAGLALACERGAPGPKLDQMVLARIAKEPALASAHVKVRADGSHVFLTGRVQTEDQRNIAGEIADDVYGVLRVTNDIQVDVSGAPPVPPPETTSPETMPPEVVPSTPPGQPAPNEAPENS